MERFNPFFYNFFKFFLAKVFVFIKKSLYLRYQKTKTIEQMENLIGKTVQIIWKDSNEVEQTYHNIEKVERVNDSMFFITGFIKDFNQYFGRSRFLVNEKFLKIEISE